MHSAFVIDSKLCFECNSHTIEAREESRYDRDVRVKLSV